MNWRRSGFLRWGGDDGADRSSVSAAQLYPELGMQLTDSSLLSSVVDAVVGL